MFEYSVIWSLCGGCTTSSDPNMAVIGKPHLRSYFTIALSGLATWRRDLADNSGPVL